MSHDDSNDRMRRIARRVVADALRADIKSGGPILMRALDPTYNADTTVAVTAEIASIVKMIEALGVADDDETMADVYGATELSAATSTACDLLAVDWTPLLAHCRQVYAAKVDGVDLTVRLFAGGMAKWRRGWYGEFVEDDDASWSAAMPIDDAMVAAAKDVRRIRVPVAISAGRQLDTEIGAPEYVKSVRVIDAGSSPIGRIGDVSVDAVFGVSQSVRLVGERLADGSLRWRADNDPAPAR